MPSTAVGEAPRRRSGAADLRAKPSGAALVLGAVALVGASTWLDLGYYAPRGDLAAGTLVEARERQRDRATVAIVAEMAKAPGARPTLADAVRFFGLEESTLRCSAAATSAEDDLPPARVQAIARQPRAVGDKVVLCLD